MLLERFNGILSPDKSALILDIDCGIGFFLWYLQKNNFTNEVGIDVSTEQVEVVKRFGINGVRLPNWKNLNSKTNDEIQESL